MVPLFWIVGGVAAAIGTLIASSDSDDNSYEVPDDFAEREAAREKARREREAQKRRKKASLEEAKGNYSRVNDRHQRRIASAKSAAARSKARHAEIAAVERDLDNLFK